VLSVMNGFQKEIRGRILGVASHLEITGMNNRLDNWRGAMAVARQDAPPHPGRCRQWKSGK
jgi:lipoprotein-releasing system permease protein